MNKAYSAAHYFNSIFNEADPIALEVAHPAIGPGAMGSEPETPTPPTIASPQELDLIAPDSPFGVPVDVGRSSSEDPLIGDSPAEENPSRNSNSIDLVTGNELGTAIDSQITAGNSPPSDPLFVPVDPNQVNVSSQASDPTILRETFARVNFDQLSSQAGVTRQTLSLNLFDDTRIQVNFDAAEFSFDRSHLVRTGTVEGADYSEVTLVKSSDQDLAVANIRVDDKAYQVRFAGNGIHRISEVDLAAFPDEGEPDLGTGHQHGNQDDEISPVVPTSDKPGAADVLTNAIAADSEVDDGSLIDVLVTYTPTARAIEGGTAGMNAVIALAESEANQGYNNSGVNQQIRVVHTAEVSYTSSNSSATDVNRLQNPSDGFMDNVHTLRDTHSADMITLITAGSYGGRAYDILGTADETSYGFEDEAFNVVARHRMAPGVYTFGHELGHLQGSGHNIENAGSPSFYPFPYSFGYRDTANGFRSIMSYQSNPATTRINYWSNPNVNYLGNPVGSSTANNALSLNNTAIYAANWRHSNDHFDNAEVLSGSSVTTTGLNVNATEETGEIDHAGNSGGQSVWWSWTAPASGSVTLNTAGSNFDTLLGVYTGSSVTSLTEVASNDDDASGGLTSRVTFNAVAGTTYKIAVDGYNGDSGSINLNLQGGTTTGPVDLSGQYFNVVQEPRNAGDSFDVQFRVQNTEAGNAGPFDVKFYLSDNDYFSGLPSFDRLLGSYNVSNVNGNSTSNLLSTSLTLPLPGDSYWDLLGDDRYYIGMMIDKDNNVVETNEGNNHNQGEFKDYDGVLILNT